MGGVSISCVICDKRGTKGDTEPYGPAQHPTNRVPLLQQRGLPLLSCLSCLQPHALGMHEAEALDCLLS